MEIVEKTRCQGFLNTPGKRVRARACEKTTKINHKKQLKWGRGGILAPGGVSYSTVALWKMSLGSFSKSRFRDFDKTRGK